MLNDEIYGKLSYLQRIFYKKSFYKSPKLEKLHMYWDKLKSEIKVGRRGRMIYSKDIHEKIGH